MSPTPVPVPVALATTVTAIVTLTASTTPTPTPTISSVRKASQSAYVDILLAWAGGFLVSGLVVLMLIIVCNFKRQVLLHKLIFLEMFLAVWRGFQIFFDDPVYGWYLGGADILLYLSYFLHNVVAWMKIRPFLSRRGTLIYLISLCFVQVYWFFDAWGLWEHYDQLGDDHYQQIRPWEVFVREPWWIFTCFYLIWVLKKRYNCGLLELIRTSARFGVMLFCVFTAAAFEMADLVASFKNLNGTSGVNIFWPIALVMKCATDTIFLDDFRVVLNALVHNAMQKAGGQVHGAAHNGYGIQVHGAAHNGYGLSSGQSPGVGFHDVKLQSSQSESGRLSMFNRDRPQGNSSVHTDALQPPPSVALGFRQKLDQRRLARRNQGKDLGESQIFLETSVTVESVPAVQEHEESTGSGEFQHV